MLGLFGEAFELLARLRNRQFEKFRGRCHGNQPPSKVEGGIGIVAHHFKQAEVEVDALSVAVAMVRSSTLLPSSVVAFAFSNVSWVYAVVFCACFRAASFFPVWDRPDPPRVEEFWGAFPLAAAILSLMAKFSCRRVLISAGSVRMWERLWCNAIEVGASPDNLEIDSARSRQPGFLAGAQFPFVTSSTRSGGSLH